MRSMKRVLNSRSMPKWVVASVLNLLLVSGVQAESIGKVYETLALVQEVIAVSHPSVIQERYRYQEQDRYRFEQKLNNRNVLTSYTHPCYTRSGRYDDACRHDRSDRYYDHSSRHHRHDYDDRHPGKHHGKHKRKHGSGHYKGSHRHCHH